jgi:hypothetical protein
MEYEYIYNETDIHMICNKNYNNDISSLYENGLISYCFK